MNNLNPVTGKANKTLVGNLKGFRYRSASFRPVLKAEIKTETLGFTCSKINIFLVEIFSIGMLFSESTFYKRKKRQPR